MYKKYAILKYMETLTSRLKKAIKIYTDLYMTEDHLINDMPITRVTFYRIKGGFWEKNLKQNTKWKLNDFFNEMKI